MAEARSRDRWNHTASQLALVANCHRDPKKGKAFRPQDFHPHSTGGAKRQPKPQADITLLKQVFVDGRK